MTVPPPRFRLIGMPTDRNSSFERGAAAGPAAIREALWSERGNAAAECGLEMGSDFLIDDMGDLPLAEANSDDDLMRDAVAAALANDAVPISLGGDHAITFPIFEAIAARHGPVDILHIDAHPDLYDDFEGNPRSHASPFARIMERGLAGRLVQVGIRTLNRHCREQAERFGVEVIDMRSFAPDRVSAFDRPTYLSIDLDGIDPAYAPGVAHAEPGGLSVREVLATLGRVRGPIVGADIVELNPARDLNGITAILAAKLVREVAARATRNSQSGSRDG
ncbi:MAG: agmatinase [Proteobacteria bacterium]|nr:agmatinase [Pseudomonadota bacterium]